MEQEPLISVIIPTYNREKTIDRAVDSVLKQTYSNLEVIVVDDGSSDRTEEIVKGISDPRVRFYKLPQNGGAGHARNEGVKLAGGELIAFHDSDGVEAGKAAKTNGILAGTSGIFYGVLCISVAPSKW